MNKESALTLKLELIWWLVTLLILFGVLYPIYTKIDGYPFYIENTVFVIVFVTFTRYIFLLKHTFLAYRQKLKAGLFFLAMWLLFYLIDAINNFQTSFSEAGLEPLFHHLPLEEKISMSHYIRNELSLFGVGSAIATVVFMFRLLISVWRVRNRGTV